MRIERVEKPSPADRAGLRAGDEILSVNGEPIGDSLDFLFHTAEEELRLEVRRAGGPTEEIEIVRTEQESLGIILPEDPVRRCGNHCVFCFIDQNPKGLRRSLYVKDEDYRLSLLYGNYITLTKLREWEITRIIEQHLSPLYVSVHATDPGVRRRLFRFRDRDDIIALMVRLGEAGIRMHTQIVLVPGFNDGDILERTLDDLESLHPGVQSVALVPVGLTAHRHGLTPLRLVAAGEAEELVDLITKRQQQCMARFGSRLHFLADELYLLARRPIPAEEAYESFPQIENGVGMVRKFERDLSVCPRLFSKPLPPGWGPGRRPGGRQKPKAVLVTGTLFAPILEPLLESAMLRTGEAGTFDARVLGVQNRLFGTTVTVAGLLAGGDIVAALDASAYFDLAVLPPDVLNTDGVLLDHRAPTDLAREIGRPVQVGFGGQLFTGS